MIVAGQLGRKPAADAAAVYEYVIFRVLPGEGFVDELRVVHELRFAALAGAFAEAAVVDHHHFVPVAGEIAGELAPALDAAGIAVKIQQNAFGRCYRKMKAVDAHARRRLKKQFLERLVVAEYEIRLQFLRFENEPFLDKIHQEQQQQVTGNDVYDRWGHVSLPRRAPLRARTRLP